MSVSSTAWALGKSLRRLCRTLDALGGVVDAFKIQVFRVVVQLAEGSRADVALETERPKGLFEGEGVGDAVRKRLQCVGICSEMFHFLWCECLSHAHTVPPSGDFIIPQMRHFAPMCPPIGTVGHSLVSTFWGTVYAQCGSRCGSKFPSASKPELLQNKTP